MNVDLLENLLLIAMTNSTIACAFIQKTKGKVNKKILLLYTFSLNIALGISFTTTFTDFSLFEGVWVGLFSFIGADALYKALEGKLKSHSELIEKDEAEEIEEIQREDI